MKVPKLSYFRTQNIRCSFAVVPAFSVLVPTPKAGNLTTAPSWRCFCIECSPVRLD